MVAVTSHWCQWWDALGSLGGGHQGGQDSHDQCSIWAAPSCAPQSSDTEGTPTPRRAGLAETRRAVVFVIVGVPLWPLAMFWDGVRLRGGETEPGGCRPQRWCRCARAWDASGARQGRQANTTTCTAPFGLRPTTELRHGGDSAPGRAASARRWVPQLFFRQPQSSGGDKGALTAVRRCSEG